MMGTILSSKEIDIPYMEQLEIDEISEWFESVKRGRRDCRLILTLKTMTRKRASKKSAEVELKDLIPSRLSSVRTRLNGSDEFSDMADGKHRFRRWRYFFNFEDKKYFCDGKELYLTPAEELFLYRWLILNESIINTQRFYLYNMRKKFGRDFLEEALVQGVCQEEEDDDNA